MKPIITLPAITLLTALALAGCSQNSSTTSPDTSATNSSMTGGESTNMPSTNSLPGMSTNMPASTN